MSLPKGQGYAPRIEKRIGLNGFEHPIVVLDRRNQHQSTVAQLAVNLPTRLGFDGADKPAMMDILSGVRGELTIRNLPEILHRICRHFQTNEATIEAEFPYFLQAESARNQGNHPQVYPVSFIATIRDETVSFTVGVTVPIRFFRGDQRLEGHVQLKVKADDLVWIEDMVSWVQDTEESLLSNAQRTLSGPPQESDFIRCLLTKIQEVKTCRDAVIVFSAGEHPWQCRTFSETKCFLDDAGSPDQLPEPSHLADDEPMFSFGAWLREQRQARHLSQSDLAQKLGLTPSFLSRLERDERSPSRNHLIALAEVLGLDTEIVLLRAGVLPSAVLRKIQLNPENYL